MPGGGAAWRGASERGAHPHTPPLLRARISEKAAFPARPGRAPDPPASPVSPLRGWLLAPPGPISLSTVPVSLLCVSEGPRMWGGARGLRSRSSCVVWRCSSVGLNGGGGRGHSCPPPRKGLDGGTVGQGRCSSYRGKPRGELGDHSLQGTPLCPEVLRSPAPLPLFHSPCSFSR